jgi:poly-gamma-glutamate synthesis protein (capsule biosynthesis protein)
VRAVIRLGAAGVFLSSALAAGLLVHPTQVADQRATLTTYRPPTVPVPHRSGPLEPGLADVRRPQRHVSVVMSGDLLWHDTVWESAHEDAARAGLHQRFDF